MSLEGRVALVTGVSRSIGIGWAIARRLLDEGASVLATGWTPHDDEMPWGATPITNPGQHRSLAFEEADLGDPYTPEALVESAVDRYGGIDIVVAAHARSAHTGLFDTTITELDDCWRINARASLLLVRALAERRDADRGTGRAVLFTSGQHIAPMDGAIAYAVSKGAIHQMTGSLANAVADLDITVNCINPGPVDTGYASGEKHASVAAAFPSGRWGRPDDVANLTAWLVGDEAAWITGQVLNSEGGFRRWKH